MIVARAEKPIVRAQTLAGGEPRKRDEQSPADSLFADIIREETGADAAFLPGVGYGVAIPAGPIAESTLRNLIPHDAKVVTMQLSGREILETLEQAVKNTFADEPPGIIAFNVRPSRNPPAKWKIISPIVALPTSTS